MTITPSPASIRSVCVASAAHVSRIMTSNVCSSGRAGIFLGGMSFGNSLLISGTRLCQRETRSAS